MRVLGIDTCTHLGVLGLIEDGKPRGEVRFGIRPGGGEKMPRVLQDMLRDIGWTPKALDLIVAGIGPGSYTGMRVGLAFARSLAVGLKRPMVTISTHQAIAQNAFASQGLVAVLGDARREQVYTTIFSSDPDRKVEKGPEILRVQEVCQFLNHRGQPVFFLGDGARAYQKTLRENLIIPVALGYPEDETPSGLKLARLGWERWLTESTDETERCEPLYLRRVEAEVRLDERRNTIP